MKTHAFLFLMVSMPLIATSQTPDILYQTHCSHCHGDKFQGGSAKSLVDGIWQFGNKPEQLSKSIKSGITHLGMPAYENTLTDAETDLLIQYLLEMEQKAGVTKHPLPTTLKTLDYDVNVEVWLKGLETPWSITFLNKKTALIAERPGRLRTVDKGHLHPKPIVGIPAVLAEGQGGLLDVAFDPNYSDEGNQWIYLSYSHELEPQPNGKRSAAMTKIVRGRINGNNWVDEEVLFEAPHETYRTTRHHFGTRLVFDKKGHLYFSIGDRGTGAHAQDLSRPNGKIHRIHLDGKIPKDNPFRRTKGAMPSIYSYGHRNPQGISMHPETGRIWAAEHGPLGGDELNLIKPKLNYGWPIITYGKNYNGTPITDIVRNLGMEQPVWYWNPSPAVCGIDFYQGKLFPKWNNKLLVGALKYEDLRVLDLENDRVMHEEVILKNAGRVRDVVCGPEGAIYVVLNSPDIILRLTPRHE
jgi:glucose/arabinose dehydrogenase